MKMHRTALAGLLSCASLAAGSAAAQQCGAPLGSVTAFMGRTPPAGWLLADGRVMSRQQFDPLFAVIGTMHGAGFNRDGTKEGDFNLPDLRGRFLRGVDLDANGLASGEDPDAGARVAALQGGNAGNAVGSYQTDAMQSHKHPDRGHRHGTNANRVTRREQGDNSSPDSAHPDQPPATIDEGHANLGDPSDSGTGAGTPRHGKETRPRNIAVQWIICVA